MLIDTVLLQVSVQGQPHDAKIKGVMNWIDFQTLILGW